MDFFYHGAWRMDWGLGNPNKTAALIACLMAGLWTVAWIWRWGFWLALPIFVSLAWCQVQTYSRGGMLASLGGMAVLLAFAPRPWPRARAFAGLAAAWIIGMSILQAGAEIRYDQGIFQGDPSINTRLEIWNQLPEMLAAAPWGCGWGRAGDVYTQWFQPLDQSENFLNLINSHFTWMLEGGWGFAAFYIWTWMMVLWLCWPARGTSLRPVGLAVWVALGISGCFSHVEDSPFLWILPLGFLAWNLRRRYCLRQWPRLLGVGLLGLWAGGVVVAVISTGWLRGMLPISMDEQGAVLGRGARINIILVDRKVMGNLYGHALRKFLARDPAGMSSDRYIVTESAGNDIPLGIAQTVVSGQRMRDAAVASILDRSRQIILINPEAPLGAHAWGAALASRTSIYFGEYAQVPSRAFWAGCANARTGVIAGAADFVPSWPTALWRRTGI